MKSALPMWPETKDQPCQFCGAVLHLARQGIAPEFKAGFKAPKRGTGYYYTANKHRCAEGEKIRKNLEGLGARIERAILGKKR